MCGIVVHFGSIAMCGAFPEVYYLEVVVHAHAPREYACTLYSLVELGV
jgi:hypothetical protein